MRESIAPGRTSTRGAGVPPRTQSSGAPLKLVFVEPFHGGSHAAFAEGWLARSRHEWQLISLPAESWKWRQRLSAWSLAPRLASLARLAGVKPDCVVVSGLIDLAHLRLASGLGPDTPFLLYMHENQLSYPRPPGESLERSFAVSHIASLLSADGVAFNSRSHRDSMKSEMKRFLAAVPAPRPRGVVGRIGRARVLYPGVDFDGFPVPAKRAAADPPVIVWNHRWEEDKRPAAFARVMLRLAEGGADFRLVLLGTGTQVHPKPLHLLQDKLGPRILKMSPARSRAQYIAWLSRGDVSVSTAAQENFGYSAVEAMAAGAIPLMPARLSYPELLPKRLAGEMLYDGDAELESRLARFLASPATLSAVRSRAMRHARRFAWAEQVERLDDWVAGAVPQAGHGRGESP